MRRSLVGRVSAHIDLHGVCFVGVQERDIVS